MDVEDNLQKYKFVNAQGICTQGINDSSYWFAMANTYKDLYDVIVRWCLASGRRFYVPTLHCAVLLDGEMNQRCLQRVGDSLEVRGGAKRHIFGNRNQGKTTTPSYGLSIFSDVRTYNLSRL